MIEERRVMRCLRGRCCGGTGAAAVRSHVAAARDPDVAVATASVHGFTVWDRTVVADDVGSTHEARVCAPQFASGWRRHAEPSVAVAGRPAVVRGPQATVGGGAGRSERVPVGPGTAVRAR
ncbi:hypothetical protein Ait01nite_040380 [Actinoplanes italicus]|nr:hypothetical protein Ait01nite_040380 [Actinoplanes italicus]